MDNEFEHWPYDKIVHLRLWGADIAYALSESVARIIHIGTSDVCTLRLTDQDVSPIHAELIVQVYANDAIAELGAGPSCFSDDDCKWATKHGAISLSEIEKATLRIVAVNMSGSVHRAAKRLRMAYISLSRWFHRREAIPYFATDRNP